jgi:hypothetical protein
MIVKALLLLSIGIIAKYEHNSLAIIVGCFAQINTFAYVDRAKEARITLKIF